MISCRNLTRRFGDFVAVDELQLEVPEGAICAFLGPNGAGKSTTVKMLTGLLKPSSGEAFVADYNVAGQPLAVKRLIGVLPENLGLFGALTVEEHLYMTGPIYGLSRNETRSRADALLRALALDDGRYTFIDHCSYGMRKKTALAMALIHNPRVLFLDEPFEGLDPVTSLTLRRLVATLAERRVTIFLTSHILPIVEKLTTQVVMIREGRLVWNSLIAGLPKSLEDVYFDLVEAPVEEDLPWLGCSRS